MRHLLQAADLAVGTAIDCLVIPFLILRRHFSITALNIGLVTGETSGLAAERHIPAPGRHRAVCEGRQREGHILLPELEIHKLVAELRRPQHLVNAHYACPEHSPGGTVASETVIVGLIADGSIERQGIIRDVGAERTLVADAVGKCQDIIGNHRDIMAESHRVAVIGMAGAQPLRCESHVALGPDASGRSPLLVPGIVHQSKPDAAVEHMRLALGIVYLIFVDETPVLIEFEKSRHIRADIIDIPHLRLLHIAEGIRSGREGVIPVLVPVDARAVDFVLIVPAEMIAGLPVQVVRDMSCKIGLRIEDRLVETVVRIVAVQCRIRFRPSLYGLPVIGDIHPFVIITGLEAVESVEVESLVYVVRGGGGPAHPRNQILVVMLNLEEHRTLREI